MTYKEFVTPSGSKERTTFSPKVLDDGSIVLTPSGKENIYEFIQSFKDSVDIHVILKKCANGDMSALSKVQGFYGDVTAMPKNNAEMLQLFIDAQNNFEALPIDVKKEFDHDFNKWFSSMNQPDWFEKMKFPKKKEEVVPDPEPVEVKE